MRSRVVSLRDIHEKYKVEVRRFVPAFVIPRHAPGWETLEGAEAQGVVFRPAQPDLRTRPDQAAEPLKRSIPVEVKRRD